MRLTKNNIKFVKRIEKDEVTYCWFVMMKSGRISDAREYINYLNGRTTAEEYSMDRLPAAVRNFVNEHEESIFCDARETAGYVEYIYR